MTAYQTFENLILILIVLSSIKLCVDNPLNNPNSSFQLTINYLDYLFNVLFIMEAGIKIISFGFLFCSIPN